MKALTLLLLLTSPLLYSCDKEPVGPDPVTFEAPDNLIPADNIIYDSANISLSWDAVDKASRYEIWIDTSTNPAQAMYEYIGTKNSYDVPDSLANGLYNWEVRAGNDSVWSKWSPLSRFTVEVEPEVVVENVILVSGAEVKLLSASQDFNFLEGPAFDGDKLLYFSDINNEKINVYNVETKSFQVFRAFSNKCNGLMFNSGGQLVACEGGTGKVVVHNAEGVVVETLAETYNDVRFNSPNDLVIDSEGGIYFTDPTWSDPPQVVKGVYYIEPDGDINRLVDDMDKPNGVIFSPNGSHLYINDSNSKTVRVYEILSPGSLSSEFETITLNSNSGNNTGADGMAMDVNGNLYVTTGMGVQVFDKGLNYLLTINVPDTPANCTFGGDELKTLYITARKNLYSIQLNNSGVTFPLD